MPNTFSPSQLVRTEQGYTIDGIPITITTMTGIDVTSASGQTIDQIGRYHGLTAQQVETILSYVESHQSELDAVYDYELSRLVQERLTALVGTHRPTWKDYLAPLLWSFLGLVVLIKYLLYTLHGEQITGSSWGVLAVFLVMELVAIGYLVILSQTTYHFEAQRVTAATTWFTPGWTVNYDAIVDIYLSIRLHESKSVRIITHNDLCYQLRPLTSILTALRRCRSEV